MARKQCSEPGCGRPVKGQGLCGKHYQQWRKDNKCGGWSVERGTCEHCSGPILGPPSWSRRKYCSIACRDSSRAAPEFDAECKECKKPIHSRKTKRQYCSPECLHAGQAKRLAVFNEQRMATRVERVCLNCGTKMMLPPSRPYNYCSKACWREYFVARFDRWLSNPGTVLSPLSYDEFLAQEELPCLVDGCDWRGHRLGAHVNKAHGISSDDLRKMVGFNATTGLVTTEESRKMSHRAREWMGEKGCPLSPSPENMAAPFPKFQERPETRQHRERAIALGLYAGENNHTAKLTWEQVKEIRQHLRAKDLTHKELAEKYGVCPQNISHIAQGISWKEPQFQSGDA